MKHLNLITFTRRLNKNAGPDRKNYDKQKNASILVPFCHNEFNQPCLLFTVRSSNLVNHRGEVSFPGGMQEDVDNNCLIRTSVRETVEELGISEERITTYGCINAIPGRTSSYLVHPVLAYIDLKDAQLNINPDEVESVFLVTLRSLCCENNWRKTNYKVGYTMPVYIDKFRNTPRIWGLTALAVHLVLSGLLPNQFKISLSLFKPVKK